MLMTLPRALQRSVSGSHSHGDVPALIPAPHVAGFWPKAS